LHRHWLSFLFGSRKTAALYGKTVIGNNYVVLTEYRMWLGTTVTAKASLESASEDAIFNLPSFHCSCPHVICTSSITT